MVQCIIFSLKIIYIYIYIYRQIEIIFYNVLGASWLHKLKNEILKEYDDFSYEDTSTTIKSDNVFVAYEAPMRAPNQNKKEHELEEDNYFERKKRDAFSRQVEAGNNIS